MADASTRPKNLLFLICDQLQRDALDVYGGPVATQAWRRLAEAGMCFQRCYCASPLCVPTRPSMMTGRWPHAHGSMSFGEGYETIHRSERLLTDHLLDHGYHVGYDGIWHINRPEQERRQHEYAHFMQRGFPYDIHKEMCTAQSITQAPRTEVRTPSDGGRETWQCSTPTPSEFTGDIDAHPDMEAANTIASFIREAPDDRPFAAWCSIGAPHPPICVPKPFCELFRPEGMVRPPGFDVDPDDLPYAVGLDAPGHQCVADWTWDDWAPAIAAYYGYVAFADACMQRVLDALTESGHWDDTVIIATADHGEMLGALGMYQKGNMYDRASAVPCVLSGPNIPHGGFPEPVSHVDFAPTLLAALDLPPLRTVQGDNLLPCLAEETPAPRHQFIEFNGHVNGGVKMRAAVSKHHKLVYYPDEAGQLFDLESDPDELNNRIADPELADVRLDLAQRLSRWMTETGDLMSAPSHI